MVRRRDSARCRRPARSPAPDRMQETFIRIAGITIAIRCDDPRVTCLYEGAVTRFLIDPAPPDVELDVVFLERYEPPRGELLFDSGAVWKMFAEEGGVRIECQSAMI